MTIPKWITIPTAILSFITSAAVGLAWFALVFMSLSQLSFLSSFVAVYTVASALSGGMFFLITLHSTFKCLKIIQQYNWKGFFAKNNWPKLSISWLLFLALIPFIFYPPLGLLLRLALAACLSVYGFYRFYHTRVFGNNDWKRWSMLGAIILTLFMTPGIHSEWLEALCFSMGMFAPRYLAFLAMPGYIAFSMDKMFEAFNDSVKAFAKNMTGAGNALRLAASTFWQEKSLKSFGHLLSKVLDNILTFVLIVPHFIAEGVHCLWGYLQKQQYVMGMVGFIANILNEIATDLPGYVTGKGHHHGDIKPMQTIWQAGLSFFKSYKNIALLFIAILPILSTYIPLLPSVSWTVSISSAYITMKVVNEWQRGWVVAFINIVAHLTALATGITAAFLFKDIFSFLPMSINYLLGFSALVVESTVNKDYLEEACGYHHCHHEAHTHNHSDHNHYDPSVYADIKTFLGA